MFELSVVVWAGLAALGLGLVYLLGPIVTAGKAKRTPDHSSEMYYPNYPKDGNSPFPRLIDDASRYVSLIVPAYNEEERLPVMLDEMLQYLKARQSDNSAFTWEIIVVDDGSKDRTCEVVKRYSAQEGTDAIRLLKLYRNHGKGGAVRKGMMRSRGEYLLMVDADGATVASEFTALEARIREVETEGGHGIAVGSRAHLQEEAVATRKWYRNVLMYGFHTLVLFLCGGHGVKDTQCGFKVFTRRTARVIFSTLHIERWAFDVEMLFIAAKLRIPIAEVAVKWSEIDGSKLNVFDATVQMLRDLVLIRGCYLFGFWTIEGQLDGLQAKQSVWKNRKRE